MELLELKNDQEFMDRLAEADDVSAVKELLQEKGFEMTDDEINSAFEQADKELSEDDLDSVSGGYIGLLGGVMALAFLIGIIRGSRC